MTSLFEKLNITNYTFFPAVYYKENKYENEIKQFLSTKSGLTDSEKGCLLSHLLIMRDFINSDFDRIAIFEDDANTYLSKDQLLLEVEKAFQNFDPDFLFLGKLTDNCSNLIQMKDNLFKNTMAYGSHAYVINKKIANHLLTQPPINLPIDLLVYNLILKNKEFDSMTFHPSLFYQDVHKFNSQIRKNILFDKYTDCSPELSSYLLYWKEQIKDTNPVYFFIFIFIIIVIIFAFSFKNGEIYSTLLHH